MTNNQACIQVSENNTNHDDDYELVPSQNTANILHNDDIDSNIVEDDEQEESPEGYSWQPPNEMCNLPTKIFKDNLLTLDERKSILQAHPYNKHIGFKPPTMDKGLWKYMPKNTREYDKSLAKILYRTSAAICPLDNSLCLLYDSKPDDSDNEALESWKALKQSLLDTRSLILDSLSFTNEIRQLKNTLEKENAKNKLVHNSFYYQKHQNISYKKFDNRKQYVQFKEQLLQHKAKSELNMRSKIHSPQQSGLCLHIANWIEIFEESWVTRIISKGYSPIWASISLRIKQPISHHHYDQEIMTEIKKFLKKGIIKSIPTTTPCFISRIFLVPKKNDKSQLVLDLRKLNQYLTHYHFKMEGIEMVKTLIFTDHYMVSLNIKDAFLHIPINRQDQSFFAFDFHGKHYVFTALPFGIRIIAYLNDLFIVENTKSETTEHLNITFHTLNSLDTSKMTISLPHLKVKEVIRECKSILTKTTIHIRKLASIIGKLIATTNVIFLAHLMTRALLRNKNATLKDR
ncbi:15259_t:CDS:2, partial [Cetraspora pellucida]